MGVGLVRLLEGRMGLILGLGLCGKERNLHVFGGRTDLALFNVLSADLVRIRG